MDLGAETRSRRLYCDGSLRAEAAATLDFAPATSVTRPTGRTLSIAPLDLYLAARGIPDNHLLCDLLTVARIL